MRGKKTTETSDKKHTGCKLCVKFYSFKQHCEDELEGRMRFLGVRLAVAIDMVWVQMQERKLLDRGPHKREATSTGGCIFCVWM